MFVGRGLMKAPEMKDEMICLWQQLQFVTDQRSYNYVFNCDEKSELFLRRSAKLARKVIIFIEEISDGES